MKTMNTTDDPRGVRRDDPSVIDSVRRPLRVDIREPLLRLAITALLALALCAGVVEATVDSTSQIATGGRAPEVRGTTYFVANDVDPSFNRYFMSVKADVDNLADIDMDFNLFHTSNPGAFIVDIVGITGSYTADEWAIYKSDTGWDASSPSPADPLFVNAAFGDFHLSNGSPAIGSGQAVSGITTDYDGQPRDDPPSLGALRYLPGDLIFLDGFESGDLGAWN